jgi:ABC-type branched-subunit amino acid transport system substrate-binding protein
LLIEYGMSREITQKMIPGMCHGVFTVEGYNLPLLRWAEGQGFKTFQWIAGDCTWARRHAEVFDGFLANSPMKRIGSDIFYDFTVPDITLELTKAIKRNADWTLFGTFGSAHEIQAMEQIAALDYKGFSIAATENLEPDMCQSASAGADRYHCLSTFAVDRSVPANKAFVDAYSAEFGEMPTQYSWFGYTAAMLMMQALDLAGPDASMEKIGQAYAKVDWTTPMGYKIQVRARDGQEIYPQLFITKYDPRTKTMERVYSLEPRASDMPLYR